MAVTSTNPAPYAPASAVLEIIDRYRNRGLSKPFTPDVLARAGVSDSLIPRTMQALTTLDLISDDGTPTETMESLRRATEPEFKNQLTAWISSAYADVLAFVNATDDETNIRDAFRSYNPVGQQQRMVSLFLGLCRAAGMRSDEQSTASARPRARKPQPVKQPASAQRRVTTASENARGLTPSSVPAPLAGLLVKLPPEGGQWTKADHDRWLATFTTVLDFCFSIGEKNSDEEGDDA